MEEWALVQIHMHATKSTSNGYGPGRPPRLAWIHQSLGQPLYFLTLCVADRRPVLASASAHEALVRYARTGAAQQGVAVGRYVLMPDHLHLFVRGPVEFRLPLWVRGLKRAIGDALRADQVAFEWQRGFFDHALRSSESYGQKWSYVRENPVRAGLAKSADEWSFGGEVVVIDRV
jgi:REP element-mobilizing transposase RayT